MFEGRAQTHPPINIDSTDNKGPDKTRLAPTPPAFTRLKSNHDRQRENREKKATPVTRHAKMDKNTLFRLGTFTSAADILDIPAPKSAEIGRGKASTKGRWASQCYGSLGEPVSNEVGRTRTIPTCPAWRRALKRTLNHLYSDRHFHSGPHATCTVACHLNSGRTTRHLYSGRHFFTGPPARLLYSGPLHATCTAAATFTVAPPQQHTTRQRLRQLVGVTFLKTGVRVQSKANSMPKSCKTMHTKQMSCKNHAKSCHAKTEPLEPGPTPWSDHLFLPPY